MPEAPDHLRFALRHIKVADYASAHPGLVALGAQGPDPMYFRDQLFGGKTRASERTQAFADFAHECPPHDLFAPLAAKAAASGGYERVAAFAFLFGLTLHYALDANVHPYVYSRSGFDKSGKLSGHYGIDHVRFETGMTEASAIAQGLKPSESSPRQLLKVAPVDVLEADNLLTQVFPERLHLRDYTKSWINMVEILTLLWDPSRIKRTLLDLTRQKDSRARALIRPGLPATSEPIDYLNCSRSSWPDPVSGQIRSESVADLTAGADVSAINAARLIRCIDSGAAPELGWENLADNRNHEGLKPGELARFHLSIYHPEKPSRHQ
ncbi:MAG: zinc dependent phospholipase C family protein [Spirochaetes bacterium]|nr:zinc dependent phospholipase C family protein [Spirochaetota bacterium]